MQKENMSNNIIYLNSIATSLNLSEVKNYLNIAENDTAFLAGSLIESIKSETSRNMGNRLSDIDVFILTKHIDHYKAGSSDYMNTLCKTLFRKFNGIHFDIEVYDETTILDLIEQLNNYNCNKLDEKIQNTIKLPNGISIYKFTSFLHRFITSIPLCNTEDYDRIKSMLMTDQYYRFMTRLSMNNVENMFDDVVGNMETKEYTVALILARDMLLHAIEAYLFFRKETIDRKKWIVLKFRNLSESSTDIKKLYHKFMFLNFGVTLNNDEDYKKNIKEIVKFSNRIIDEICNNNGL